MLLRGLVPLQSEWRELLEDHRFHLLVVMLKDFQNSAGFIALAKQGILQCFGCYFLVILNQNLLGLVNFGGEHVQVRIERLCIFLVSGWSSD